MKKFQDGELTVQHVGVYHNLGQHYKNTWYTIIKMPEFKEDKFRTKRGVPHHLKLFQIERTNSFSLFINRTYSILWAWPLSTPGLVLYIYLMTLLQDGKRMTTD